MEEKKSSNENVELCVIPREAVKKLYLDFIEKNKDVIDTYLILTKTYNSVVNVENTDENIETENTKVEE